MFGNAHFERVRQMFADQFEPDASGFLYRKSMKGALIRVSEAERDGYIEAFNRRLRYGTWTLVPTTVLLIGSLVVFFPDVDSISAQIFMWIGIAAILLPFMACYFWAWNAPARELERRPVLGNPRSRDEIKRLMLGKITYGHLGLAALTAVLLTWQASTKHDIFHGWGVLWLMFAGAIILGVAIQAFRKWRLERD